MAASKVSDDQLPVLWEAGIPLGSAWITFGKSFDPSTARRAHGQLLAPVPKTREGRSQKVLVTTISERAHLLDEIYAGRLWAIGSLTLASGSDKLVRILPRYFRSVDGVMPAICINWDRAELTVDGKTYAEIRVVRSPLEHDRKRARTSTSERSRPSRVKKSQSNPARQIKRSSFPNRKTRIKNVGGRPNTSKEIEKVTLKLLLKNPELANLPIKQLVPHVRAEMLGEDKRNAEEKNYKSSSMAKSVGRGVQEFRKQNKRNKPNKP